MTTPPLRTPPLPEPNQQQGYPPTEQSGPYGEQPPYVHPTDYGMVRAEVKPADRARPATVTVAAVLAFVCGGLTIISSLLSMVAGSLFSSEGSACARNDQSGLCASVAGSGGLLITIGTALIVSAELQPAAAQPCHAAECSSAADIADGKLPPWAWPPAAAAATPHFSPPA